MDVARIRFTFTCRRCGSVLEAVGAQCGRTGRCPTCGAVFVIPGVDPDTGVATGPAQVSDDGQLPTPMHAYATAGGKAPRILRRQDGTQAIVCPRCRQEMSVDANACASCGLPFTMEGASAAVGDNAAGNQLAAAALTVGVFSLVTFCLPVLGLVAVGLGIAALRMERGGHPSRSGRSMAWTGIVMGGISILGFLVTTALRRHLF